ncbi:glycosyltransferase [candidate division KSB1 bacterium]|nr:glycosyltransferase [candidate division KSB1 bacterium]
MQYATFSIIIPTYKRPRALGHCLAALQEVDYPGSQFEIIVVDDGGGVPEPLRSAYEKGRSVRFLSQKQRGPATARNTGAAAAVNDVVVFLDDDCIVGKNWLNTLSQALHQTPNHLIGGKTKIGNGQSIYGRASQYLIDFLYIHYTDETGNPQFFTSNNFALDRRAFLHSGGFDQRFKKAAGEDREFCYRWNRYGGKSRYVPSLVVYHDPQLTLKKYWHQHFNYGRGGRQFRMIGYERGGKNLTLGPSRFYINLLLYPFKQNNCALRFSVLFFLSQLANALGYAWEKYRLKN